MGGGRAGVVPVGVESAGLDKKGLDAESRSPLIAVGGAAAEFPPAPLSSARGRSFGQTLETDSSGVYGCAYQSSSEAWDWIVAVREPTDGDDPTTDGIDLGGPAAVKPVNGTGYTTIASKAGVELQYGKDVVEVYTPASDPDAQATTAQFVGVAKAVTIAISK